MTGRPWEPAVLEIIARSGQVKLAAECAGINRKTVYAHLKRDPDFADRVESAKRARVASVTRAALVRFSRVGNTG